MDRHNARAVMVYIVAEPGSPSQDACIVRPEHEKQVLPRFEYLSAVSRKLFGHIKYGTVEGVMDGETGKLAKLNAIRRILTAEEKGEPE